MNNYAEALYSASHVTTDPTLSFTSNTLDIEKVSTLVVSIATRMGDDLIP